jgi:hypothetical protein
MLSMVVTSTRHAGKPREAAAASSTAVKPGDRAGTLKRFTAACLVLSLGIILAYHFSLFWMYGQVIIEEPNRFILGLESMLSVGIIAFGLERLVRS